MENKSHALAAGAFVLGLAALLVALTFWLLRDNSIKASYVLTSPNGVTGLQPQAAVRFKGVLVGKVTGIDFDPDIKGNIKVTIAVEQDTPITRSTYATLGYQGVTGLAFIALNDRGQSQQPLVATGGKEPRIPLEPGLLGLLEEQGTRILDQVEQASQRVNQLLAPENQKVFINTLQQTGEAAQSVKQLAASTDKTVKTQFDPLIEQASRTLQSVQGTAEQTRLAVKNIDQRLSAPGGALDKLSDGTESLVQAAGTIRDQSVPQINRMAADVSRSARQLGRTAAGVSDNPQSLLFGSGAVPPGPGEPGFTPPAPTQP